jgi:hypothetical protein
MKTGTAEGNLAGTAYTTHLSTSKDATGMDTPMAIIPSGTDGNTTYTIKNGMGEAVFTIGGTTAPAWTDKTGA